MTWIVEHLWLIPALPLLAAGIIAVTRQPHRRLASTLAIGAMVFASIFAWVAFISTLGLSGQEGVWPKVYAFSWFDLADTTVRLGWLLDPLTAVMLVMVTTVSTLIFIYSVGYMAHDENATRFFCFLSLFAAAMLGLVIANSLLLFFICWELVGLTSYLLIGFWYHKPSAAAAGKKAFITTRIGDIGFFLGLLWLYSQTGTLLFYDQGQGCLEQTALANMVSRTTFEGMAVATAISLLIFCGAVGKSGQVPLHVWLPDAMEGPTPVSALIHAATMVAAGVFLVARVYPLMSAGGEGGITSALTVVTWVGSITAVFAAFIAVAQSDVKRILAYSTVSQLGYMMMALGVGGYVAGVFHLITHAFFKALLFLGAGSVIHGCHDEQDIRQMGGLKKYMPITFLTYAIGMMALAGVPVFFSGFWSKDEILHQAFNWRGSQGPFYLGLLGAFLTAFYMTRQVCYVFYGSYRGAGHGQPAPTPSHKKAKHQAAVAPTPHESPATMTVPLRILAVATVLLGVFGTPAWPWFHAYLSNQSAHFDPAGFLEGGVLPIMLLSTTVVFAGLGAGWWLYGPQRKPKTVTLDPLEQLQPGGFGILRDKFRIDEIYGATVIRATHHGARFFQWMDTFFWEGCIKVCTWLALGLAWANRLIDEYVVNWGFDASCGKVQQSGGLLSQLQNGQIQSYLRVVGVALAVLVLALAWGMWR